MRDTKLGRLAAGVAVAGVLGLGAAVVGSVGALESTGGTALTRTVVASQDAVVDILISSAAEADYHWT